MAIKLGKFGERLPDNELEDMLAPGRGKSKAPSKRVRVQVPGSNDPKATMLINFADYTESVFGPVIELVAAHEDWR